MSHEPARSGLRCNRRDWLVRTSLTVSGVALATTRLAQAADGVISHQADAIHQEIRFEAGPSRIYAILTHATLFQRLESLSDAMQKLDIKGHPARISRQPGGAFSLFGDYIVGRQVELVPDQRIVQAWRVASWAPGIYSLARFELLERGAATRLALDHIGFPAGTAPSLASGWYAHYWEPLRKMLG
jgi:activator of HSP90 ATPase